MIIDTAQTKKKHKNTTNAEGVLDKAVLDE